MGMSPREIREFVTAGKAIGTLSSAKTGLHYTYQFRRARDKKTRLPAAVWEFIYVDLLTGPDNTHDYRYIGVLTQNNSGLKFSVTKKSTVAADAGCAIALRWMLRRVNVDLPLEDAGGQFEHSGSCAVCSRPLTHPDSLRTGIGPECRKRLGVPS